MRLLPGRRAAGRSPRWKPLAVLAALVAVPGLAVTGTVSATFTAGTSAGGNTISAGTLFPQTMTTAAYSTYDAAAGTGESNTTVHLAAADGILYSTHAWGTAFSTTRYMDLKYNSPLPTGRTTTGVSFNFTFESEYPSGSIACFYFDVRRASTSALLATHGSSAAPIACQDGASLASTSTALPEVTSSDIADDLLIRVYAKEPSTYGLKIDLATVSGSADSAFTLQYWGLFDNARPANPGYFDYVLANDGDNRYLTESGWGTAFSSSQYVKWGFPSYVPATAAVTGVTFTHSFRAGAAGTACMYFEVYNGATLLGTYGSSAAPYCTSSTTAFRTDSFPLREVDTPGEVNNLVIKMYVTHSDSTAGNRITQHDRATINFSWGYR